MADPLTTGGDFEGYEDFCDTLANQLKNNWRHTNVLNYWSGLQPGMVVSEESTEKLYHVLGTSPFSDQVLQENFSEDAQPLFHSLTLDQLTEDNDQLLLQSTGDVDHGVTDVLPTSAYAAFKKLTNAQGGLFMKSATEGSRSFIFYGIETTNDNTKSTAGTGCVEVIAGKKDGTAAGNVDSDANVLAVRCFRGGSAETIAIFEATGDLYLDGTLITSGWDDYDDIVLAHDLSRLLVGQWDEFIRYNKSDLHNAGLVSITPPEKSKHGAEEIWLSVQNSLRFSFCTFAQILHRLKDQDSQIKQLQTQMKGLPA